MEDRTEAAWRDLVSPGTRRSGAATGVLVRVTPRLVVAHAGDAD